MSYKFDLSQIDWSGSANLSQSNFYGVPDPVTGSSIVSRDWVLEQIGSGSVTTASYAYSSSHAEYAESASYIDLDNFIGYVTESNVNSNRLLSPVLPSQFKLESAIFIEQSGSAITGVSIGSESLSSNIVYYEDVPASTFVNAPIGEDTFRNDTLLYISAESWASGAIDVYLKFKDVTTIETQSFISHITSASYSVSSSNAATASYVEGLQLVQGGNGAIQFQSGSGASAVQSGSQNIIYSEVSKSIENTEPGAGMILTSPNGTRYLLTVDDSGNLVTTSL